MSKLIFKKIYFKICLASLCSFFLLFGFPGMIKEMVIDVSAIGGAATYGAMVGPMISIAICEDPYTCGACINCSCGPWDDLTILPLFGGVGVVATYACKAPAFIPWGGGMCLPGEVIMGPAVSNQLMVNDGTMTNIWCQRQLGL